MLSNVIKFAASLVATIALFTVLSVSIGPAPPLGPFLNPNTGFWANAVTGEAQSQTFTLESEVLQDSVKVYYDEHQIPHIFAQNDHDLYFAQGFITARDRLWQMELQTYAAAGRLSEFLGPRTVSYDRYQRRIGMGYAAEQALKGISKNEKTRKAVEAYSAGVNAWIGQLSPKDYPLEYKIMNFEPGEWTPLRCALLFKNMTYTLAGRNSDMRMSNTRAYLGDSFISEVMDLDPSWNDPTIPADTPWDFKPLEVQKPQSNFQPSIAEDLPPFQPDPMNGSNNWAVSGEKTESGYPILANDPHLNMTLPSIWYALQLHSPNINAMGVTLPGAPSVIIGFNEDIAWGTTNVGADVWDWYEIEFRDSTLAEYRYDGEWRETTQRVEEIKVKGAETNIDTVFYTHHGPVVQDFSGEALRSDVPKYHAMRWIAYEESNEVNYFLKINSAKNYEDYRNALRDFKSPAQNWVFADRKDIALTVTGQYPLKWENQGRFISDGSDPLYDWQGWVPFEQIPSIKNPERGFVSSANQDPTGSEYPYYLDDDFAPFERGKRINDRLTAMDGITKEDMQGLQLDNYSYHAAKVLPVMLENLNIDTLSGTREETLSLLEEWDYYNNAAEVAPSIFKYWWDALFSEIWSDEYNSVEAGMSWPDRDQVAYLVLNRPDLPWYDNIQTDEKETLKDLINSSFLKALNSLEEEFGSYGNSWQWGYVSETDINHLANLPGFGKTNLFTGGGTESVNATRSSHGPSWRMIVELGPEIKGYGIYPGGQSGNPGSPFYENMIDDWNAGELYPLWFMKEEPASSDSLTYSLTID
ncbi:penicillin acylase family protein [Balneolaceae bacterium YR4-1]|uniref:Penicillin acylase family protein n=1 Tax=Halalkalibaculum roseum TaxID=2709311 RepID=A0A6M1SK29_9BACT|nr:penicillin acylase family protein [Halalkalibaculum roseum]NGP75379.1 penicillin acylase family protein [Halalkalibaculum roseum]